MRRDATRYFGRWVSPRGTSKRQIAWVHGAVADVVGRDLILRDKKNKVNNKITLLVADGKDIAITLMLGQIHARSLRRGTVL